MDRLTLTERLRRRVRREIVAPLDARVGGALRSRLNRGRAFRPVFVSGAMGSGTTLVALSMAQRFEASAVITESAHQVAATSFLHNPGVEAFPDVAAYEASIRLPRDASAERAREDLLAMYRRYARGRGDRALDKGPNVHLVRADLLGEAFPDAGFVCVFRDPVANIEGFRRKWPPFARDPLEASIRFWAWIHERFLESRERLGERAAVVEYERFVEHPEQMLDRLGERFDLAAARRRRRLPGRANVQGRGIRNVARGRIGVVRDANRQAYARLEPGEAERIREALEPLRARLREAAIEVG